MSLTGQEMSAHLRARVEGWRWCDLIGRICDPTWSGPRIPLTCRYYIRPDIERARRMAAYRDRNRSAA
jgi:hypothetical protein